MGQFFIAYLAVAGGISGGLQVVRGAVRGATRLIQGQPRAAVGEVVGGVVAPVASAVNQATQLAGNVFAAALAIANVGHQEPVVLSVPQWAGRAAGPATPEPNGVPS
jgi:hypothetical protein